MKLDQARLSKQLPKNLHDKIKLYIKESILYDHKHLIQSHDFLFQLKPYLRHELVFELFRKFIDADFPYLFSYEYSGVYLQCGNEFISRFVSCMYCRVFIANQQIVRKGEMFSELYLIFKGKVTLSLANKDENEYFTLHKSNFFGDY